MKKRLLTTLVAAIMTVTCITSISAATTATECPDCGDVLVGVDCAFRSLNSCETATTTCADHDDCTAVMYFADTISECSGCETVFSGEELHLHALGHILDSEDYEYAMDTVCEWF